MPRLRGDWKPHTLEQFLRKTSNGQLLHTLINLFKTRGGAVNDHDAFQALKELFTKLANKSTTEDKTLLKDIQNKIDSFFVHDDNDDGDDDDDDDDDNDEQQTNNSVNNEFDRDAEISSTYDDNNNGDSDPTPTVINETSAESYERYKKLFLSDSESEDNSEIDSIESDGQALEKEEEEENLLSPEKIPSFMNDVSNSNDTVKPKKITKKSKKKQVPKITKKTSTSTSIDQMNESNSQGNGDAELIDSDNDIESLPQKIDKSKHHKKSSGVESEFALFGNLMSGIAVAAFSNQSLIQDDLIHNKRSITKKEFIDKFTQSVLNTKTYSSIISAPMTSCQNVPHFQKINEIVNSEEFKNELCELVWIMLNINMGNMNKFIYSVGDRRHNEDDIVGEVIDHSNVYGCAYEVFKKLVPVNAAVNQRFRGLFCFETLTGNQIVNWEKVAYRLPHYIQNHKGLLEERENNHRGKVAVAQKEIYKLTHTKSDDDDDE